MKEETFSDNPSREAWQPFPFVAPGSFKGRVLFALRLFSDFQLAAVYPDMKRVLGKATGDVLEVGCGAQPYRHLIPAGVHYYACDSEGSEKFSYKKIEGVTYYGGLNLPFPEKTFNMVFHTQVLEHIFDCSFFLSECYRVLLPAGKMFFTVPFAARYHYIPNDYWRYTPACLEKLLTAAGIFLGMIEAP